MAPIGEYPAMRDSETRNNFTDKPTVRAIFEEHPLFGRRSKKNNTDETVTPDSTSRNAG